MASSLMQNEEALFMICAAVVGIVAIIVLGGGQLLISALKVSADARLKHQMLDRGMSPAEIEQVLNAGTPRHGKKGALKDQSPPTMTKASGTG